MAGPKTRRKRAAIAPPVGTAAGRVPLRHRLPNPPPLFVGRASEQARLGALLQGSPVAVVCGPGGIGKSALVRRALAGLRSDRVVCVAVSPADESGEQAVAEVLAALAELHGGRTVARGLLPNREELLATCIDLADAQGAWVVLDDLHHVQGPLLEDLLGAALAYARGSRFVATSRAAPRAPGLAAQSLDLGALALDELAALARSVATSLTDREAREIAADAAGSPFWLWQRLALGRAGRAPDATAEAAARVGAALLADLDPDVAAWVRALAQLDGTLPSDCLDALGAPAPDRPTLERLVQRGLVERSADGVRLHGVARAALAGGPTRPIAEALARAAAPALRLEAVRLELAAGRVEAAQAILAATAEAALAEGLGARLWQVLAGSRDARLTGLKLACAVDLGGGAASAWAQAQPAPPAPRDRLAWLVVLGQAGRAEDATAGAEALAAEVRATDPGLAAEALLVAARARVAKGDARAALALCAAVRELAPSARPELAALADAWAARAQVFAREHAAALSTVARLGARTTEWPRAIEREIDSQCAVVLANLGRQRSAQAAFERAEAGARVSPEQLAARERLARASLGALEEGRLDDARELLDELGPVAARSQELLAFAAMNELRYEAARGDLAAARRHLARLEAAVQTSGSGYWALWVASPRHYLSLLDGAPFDAGEAASPEDFPLTRALAAWHEVVATDSTARWSAEPPCDVIDAAIALDLAASAAALLAGDTRAGLRAALDAVGRAESEGLVLWEADARVAVVEAAFAGGADALGAALAELEAVAARLAPSRYDAEVRWFRALQATPLARPVTTARSVLEALAAGESRGAAARRSRALLGVATPLDRVDRRLVARAREVLGLESLARPAATVRPGFVLDVPRGRVLLPSGAAVELSGRPMLMRLLGALFDAGGAASKEALVQAVWGVGEYHPLRDDKRLQVAVRRLRVLLEPEPGAPVLLETTEDGYRLTTQLPVTRTTGV